MIRVIKKIIELAIECILFIPFMILALIARFIKKQIDIGIGPLPIIRNVSIKKALELKGYKVETYVNSTNYITKEFDIIPRNLSIPGWSMAVRYWLFIRAIFLYKCIYIYFHGGPLQGSPLLSRFEHIFFKLANIRIVVQGYGSDVHDTSKLVNLYFTHALHLDKPNTRYAMDMVSKNVRYWSKHADHIVSGCDWVYYTPFWHTLLTQPGCVDQQKFKPSDKIFSKNNPLTILHAPNHKKLKGSEFFQQAVDELINEGLEIKFILVQRISNEELQMIMKDVDLVADQLVIGWYGTFGIEAMSMGKPTLCYIDERLEELYVLAKVFEKDELPLIKCTPLNVKEKIKNIYYNRDSLEIIGKESRAFAEKYHSFEYIGKVFSEINESIGVMGSRN